MQEEIGPCELTPREEIFSRIRAFQKKLEERRVDAALLIQNVDLFYFTGTLQTGYLFIPKEGAILFFVQKDYARACLESPLPCVKIESVKDLPDLLREERKKKRK